GHRPAVGRLIQRFLAMADFLEQHLGRLVEMGLLQPNGDRYAISGALFSTLNNLPLTTSRRGEAEPFHFGRVVAAAEAHRELLGDRTLLERGHGTVSH